MATNITEEVAKNIGTALRNKRVASLLAKLLIKVAFGDLFRPLVKEALAEVTGLDPKEDLGPDIVEEGLQDSITAGYLAKQWLEEKRIPQMIHYLREQYIEQYLGLEDDETAKKIALNLLVARDDSIILANAVRDGLLSRKGQ